MRPTVIRLARLTTAGALAALIGACGSGIAPTTGPSLAGISPAPTDTPQRTADDTTPSPTLNPSTVVGPGERWIAATAHNMVTLTRTDGSGEHVAFPLVPSGVQLHPDWSPDGNQISFTLRGETDVIWIGDVDGSNTREVAACVAPCVWAREGAWSPDGTSLIFSRMVLEGGVPVSTLEIVNVRTNTSRVVLTAPRRSFFGQPRWAPDGSKVVTEIAHMPSDDPEAFPNGVALAVVNVTAATPAIDEITDPATLSNSPDWSWATNMLVFTQPSTAAGFDGPSDLVTMRPDGTGVTKLISVPSRDGQTAQPAWSPDGSRIIFVQPDTSIATIALDGSDLQPAIAAGLGRGVHPRYRPVR